MGNVLLGGCCTKEEEETPKSKEPVIPSSSPNINVVIPATVIETKDYNLSEQNIKSEDVSEKPIENSIKVYDKYQQISKLGEGFFGTVYKVKNKENDKFFALKEINKNSLLSSGKKGSKLLKEIENLKNVDNINIAKFCDFFDEQNTYYLISEFCDNGDLEEKAKNGINFCEFIVKVIMYKIFNAVDYLHKQNISHSDIKRSNIGIVSVKKNDENIPSIKDLLNEIAQNPDMQNELIEKKEISQLSKESKIFLKNLSNYDFKLLDFGVVDIFKLRDFEEMVCVSGTLSYIAPEVFSNKDTKEKDEWACGILMYILLTGNSPFDGDTKEGIINEVKNKTLDLNTKNLVGKTRNC